MITGGDVKIRPPPQFRFCLLAKNRRIFRPVDLLLPLTLEKRVPPCHNHRSSDGVAYERDLCRSANYLRAQGGTQVKTTTTQIRTEVNSPAILAFDVSKDLLNLVASIAGRLTEHEFANRTRVIEERLAVFKRRAQMAGHDRVFVVCEPTGCYHEPLLQTAHRLGLETAWVSGEAVSKMRTIETNDSGKTDIKDPYVIQTLASIGKTLKHRRYDEPYSLLREWNGLYEQADSGAVRAKCLLASQIKALFPDYGFKKDFLYGKSGRTLVEHYGANPYRIVRSGQIRFARVMRKLAPRIRQKTLDTLYAQAESSARNQISLRLAEIMEHRLRQSWEEYLLYEARKEEARGQMEALYREARQLDPKLPQAEKGVISTFHLARIIAETGPVSDFSSLRKFMRYSGLNLRERQSGTYRGKTRISKKGRSSLRKVLSQIVLPLVKKAGLFGPYYHRKKDRDGMPGTKAMTAVMRKFLKLFWGWYQSGGAFDRGRVFACASQYGIAA
jgi:transposase